MTIRAVVIGLLVSIGLATAGYVNDTWLFLSYIGGDLIPIHAFGLLLLGLLVIGPLLRLIKRWEIKPAEWVVMFSLSLMGSFIAGSGLLWTFPHPVIAPIVEYPTNAGWRRNKVLDYAPDIMMVDAKPVDAKPGSQLYKTKLAHEKVVEDFCRGKRTSAGNIAWSDVPWAAWNKTLGFWFTVLSLCFIGFVCMMVVVHRQWSTRENLSYPIALFTNELITHDGKGLLNPLFRSRAFWMGFGVAGVLLLINGYAKWNTEFISVPISVDFSPFLDKFERFRKMPIMMNLFKVNFYFAVMGLAFFLSSDVSFSLGISGWLYAGVMAPLFLAGVNMEGTAFTGGLWPFLYFGAYLGMAIMVFYLGRRFYVELRGWGQDRWGNRRRNDRRQDYGRHEPGAGRVVVAIRGAASAVEHTFRAPDGDAVPDGGQNQRVFGVVRNSAWLAPSGHSAGRFRRLGDRPARYRHTSHVVCSGDAGPAHRGCAPGGQRLSPGRSTKGPHFPPCRLDDGGRHSLDAGGRAGNGLPALQRRS